MRPIQLLFTALLAAAAPLLNPSPAQAQGATVFENARIIVGDGSAAIQNGSLVVEGTRITQVGPNVRVPAGATRVNLAGKTVMPAIIDTHVHMSPTRDALRRDLMRRAYFGVGAAMTLGSDPYDVLPMRREVIPGAARYFSAGRGITRPEPGRSDRPYWINSEAEARQAVQELASNQVDIIKIWVDDRNGMYQKLTPALYGAIIDEAHRRGQRVTAHMFTVDDTKGLLRANVDAFAHGVREKEIDEETVALFRQHPNVVLVPNMGDRGVRTDISWLRPHIPAAEFAEIEKENVDNPQQQRAFAIQARNLARLNAAGVRIALGTDGNTPWGPHVELEDMVVAGLTPMQAVVSATGNAAAFMRINDMGTIAPGKSADFIVLDANPLDDIKNTRRIASVYLRGAQVNRGAPVP